LKASYPGGGEAVYGAAVARRIVEFFTGAQQRYAAQVSPELTAPEREVLELVAAGLGTNSQQQMVDPS
jgi:DNA-binding NarL/FixJ family response regulator